ncbi:unnamed protein product, partial [Laminaria digitata]
GYEKGKLERIVSSSRCCKGRLLHYFARSAADHGGGGEGGEKNGVSGSDGGDDGASFSDWCGWHHDHSSITGAV